MTFTEVTAWALLAPWLKRERRQVIRNRLRESTPWSLKIRALVSPSMSNNICRKDVTQTSDTRHWPAGSGLRSVQSHFEHFKISSIISLFCNDYNVTGKLWNLWKTVLKVRYIMFRKEIFWTTLICRTKAPHRHHSDTTCQDSIFCT
jgi:hypothetical protein